MMTGREMTKVSSIAYAAFDTPDLERQTAYYTQILGLTVVGQDKDTCYLACPLDHRSVVLRRGATAQCSDLGFNVPRGTDLGALQEQIEQHGVEVKRQSDPQPGVGDLLTLIDPKGTRLQILHEPSLPPPSYRTQGVSPLKLGHIAFNVLDVGRIVDFYRNVLGFRFSDLIEDFFVWLRCNPDHHTVNFVRGSRAKMHHIAFEVRDWNHLQTACDFLSKSGFPTIWGPGRHGCGHNIFAYHRDPDGQIVELFGELDRMQEDLGYFEPRMWHRDRPQVPKVWPADPAASNLWGPMPPADFLD